MKRLLFVAGCLAAACRPDAGIPDYSGHVGLRDTTDAGDTTLPGPKPYDPATPRGPAMDIRPRPDWIIAWADQCGRLDIEDAAIDLPPWHYGLRFRRPSAGL